MRHVKELVEGPRAAFRTREEAGRQLGAFLRQQGAAPDAVLAVPSGGVAVAGPVAARFGVPLDVVLVRKLPLPMNPEAGFGAVTLDGQVVLNEPLAAMAGLSEEAIGRIVDRVLEGLRQRERSFAASRSPLKPADRDIIVVDDGLASGVTMQAALQELRRKEPHSLAVAVPTAPLGTMEKVEPLVDELYCLLAQRSGPFAVASFYRYWRDLTDEEAVELLGAATRREDDDTSRS
jgi:putative phosphoribosyl transferase